MVKLGAVGEVAGDARVILTIRRDSISNLRGDKISPKMEKSKFGHHSQNGTFADSFLAGKRITDK
jgi:hypothetical protein